MSQPTPGDVHVNRPLTNISIAFMQNAQNFVADKVFPNIPVSMQSDLYYTYDRGFFNSDDMKERAPGTESQGVGYDVDADQNYFAKVWALHHDIPDQRRANSDSPLMPDREATSLLSQKAMIRREKIFATNYFQSGIWGVDIQGVAAAPGAGQVLQWNDDASTPIEDVRKGKTTVLESTGFEPNTLVIQQHVLDALVDHPDIVDRIKYGQTQGRGPASINMSDLENLFKIDRILVMKGISNTAKEGATNAHSFIGGKNAMLCYSAPAPGLMTPSAGYTFSWTGFLAAGSMGSRIKRFRMENLESDRIEIQMAFDQKVVATELGYMFYDIVA